MASKTDTEARWWDLRIIDHTGVFHVHHHGTREAARERVRRMARYHYPADEGYTYKGTGATSDCVTVFKAGKHVGDIAVELLEHVPGEPA